MATLELFILIKNKLGFHLVSCPLLSSHFGPLDGLGKSQPSTSFWRERVIQVVWLLAFGRGRLDCCGGKVVEMGCVRG